MSIATIRWVNGSLRMIDQRKLPQKLNVLTCRDIKTLRRAIKTLAIRGAPALGVAAAFGVLLGIKKIRTQDRTIFNQKLKDICGSLGSDRPTAVNLFHALEQMQNVAWNNPEADVSSIKKLLKREAFRIFQQDRAVCRAIGKHGVKVIKNHCRILTICNAGALATVDYGTALGAIYAAKKKKVQVYVCETRPLLQGARLTTWELLRQKIDVTLICDNMAATLMQQRKIDMIFVGADRIALNGDVANKIGTYSLAVLARYHCVPFYVLAPTSTFDKKIKIGQCIPIEQRPSEEITFFAKRRIAPEKIKTYNPAFDVTPHQLIAGIVTERGILHPPFKKKIKDLLRHEK